jgi:hypothetical protein
LLWLWSFQNRDREKLRQFRHNSCTILALGAWDDIVRASATEGHRLRLFRHYRQAGRIARQIIGRIWDGARLPRERSVLS